MRHIDTTHDGDVYVSDGYTAISGAVTGDVVVESGRLTLTAGGVIGGNVTVLGGTAQLMGTVGGDVVNEAGDVVISGTVDGVIRGPDDHTVLDCESVRQPVAAIAGLTGVAHHAPPTVSPPLNLQASSAAPVVRPATGTLTARSTTLGAARVRHRPDDGLTANVISATRRRSLRIRQAAVLAAVVVLLAFVAIMLAIV